MTFTYNSDKRTRLLVIYQYATKKPRLIQKYIKASLQSIYDWIHKIEQNINILQHSKGQGRNPKINKAVKAKIIRTARRKPSQSSTGKLAAQYSVSKMTANRAITEKSLLLDL